MTLTFRHHSLGLYVSTLGAILLLAGAFAPSADRETSWFGGIHYFFAQRRVFGLAGALLLVPIMPALAVVARFLFRLAGWEHYDVDRMISQFVLALCALAIPLVLCFSGGFAYVALRHFLVNRGPWMPGVQSGAWWVVWGILSVHGISLSVLSSVMMIRTIRRGNLGGRCLSNGLLWLALLSLQVVAFFALEAWDGTGNPDQFQPGVWIIGSGCLAIAVGGFLESRSPANLPTEVEREFGPREGHRPEDRRGGKV